MTTVEYALLLVLMALVSVAAWTVLGGATVDSAGASARAMPPTN